VLSPEFTVAASVRNGAAVLKEVPIVHPDIIVLDISMGQPNGIEVARQLKESGCSAKILFLTVHQSVEYLQAALDAGGSAYVIKSRLNDDLLPAVRAVSSNCLFISPTIKLCESEIEG
jgi:DNA-binding NarL/FixJ family response regulator